MKHLQADPSLPVIGVWRDSLYHSLAKAPDKALLGFYEEKIVWKIKCSVFVSDPNTLIFKVRVGEKFFLFSIQFISIYLQFVLDALLRSFYLHNREKEFKTI